MGPLKGIKVIEIASIGPGPYAAMMLADMGATVIRVDRTQPANLGINMPPSANVMMRGRRSVAVDLKSKQGIETVLKLIEGADAVIEGFRPGVMERLGLSPEVCLARNPRLVFGRMTGYGQNGDMSTVAGHDINYLALSGVLNTIGEKGRRPVPPLNLVGDFGGGGMYLAFGVLCGILEAKSSGKGQVVDCAMVEGATVLANIIMGLRAIGEWSDERGSNTLDGGAHFYGTYETKDGGWFAVGAIEPPFYSKLLTLMGLDEKDFQPQMDKSRWPAWQQRFAEVFRTKTRAEWAAILEHEDTCANPVLTFEEAQRHPHNVARGVFATAGGVAQAAPAPRFSRTPGGLGLPPQEPGANTDDVLAEFGFGAEEIAKLRVAKVVG
ncbi:MAG: CoA transferase [Gammaproteobacteria bacterium]|nr:CoA transferase [Gammaproteobacteria bacterium]